MLVTYLAEEGKGCMLRGAISLGNPLDLTMCDQNWSQGVAQVRSQGVGTRV